MNRDEQGNFAPTVSDEDLWALYVEDPSAKKVAKHFELSVSQVRKRLAKIREKMGVVTDPDIDRAGKLEKLLGSIPLHGPGGARLKEASVKLYGIGAKDELTQKIVKEGLDSTGAVYKFDVVNNVAPEFLIQPATPAIIKYSPGPTILRKTRRIAILSDAQIGNVRIDGQIVPTHDMDAIEAARGIVRDFAPHELGSIGDWGDVTMFSRWPKKPEYIELTNLSNKQGHEIFASFISAAGPQLRKKRLVKGNHDDRYQNWARDMNLEAQGLRRATDTTGWPVLSMEYLMSFDELGIEVTEPYPKGIWWLTDTLCATHAPTKKLEMAASVIHGHLHKLTRTTWGQTNFDGRVTYFQYDIGCLCKIDGTVPSDRARTDWAQGICLVEIIDGKFPIHNVEQVHIENGHALWAGNLYGKGRVYDAEVA